MAIFKDTADFRNHCPQLSKQFDWPTLSIMSEQAQQMYVEPYLGAEFLAELATKYAGSPSAEEAVAIGLLQKAVAFYTYMDLINTHGVKVTDRGIQESYSDDSTSRPAGHYQRNDARLQAANWADQYLDKLLAYLEATVIGDKTKFEKWQESDAYKNLFSNLIWSFDQFKRFIQGVQSRRILFAITPQINWVQQRDLKPLLGETQYNELIAAIQERPDTALSDKLVALIDHVQPWLAVTAFNEAIPSLRLQYREGGIHFITYDGPLTKSLTSASNDGIRHLQTQLQEKSQGAWTTLTRWLNDNLDDYPGATATGTANSDGTYNYPTRIFNNRGSVTL